MNHHLKESNGILNLKIMKKQIIEQIGRQKNPLNENQFDKIFKAFDKKDYFGTNQYVKNQIRNWEMARDKDQKGWQKYDEKKIDKIIRSGEYEKIKNSYRKLETAVKNKDINYLTSILRHDQPVSKAFFADITGKKLPRNTRDIHDMLNDLYKESVNEGDNKEKLMNGGMKTWWKFPKEDVMGFVYWLQRQTPPTNKAKFDKEWESVKIQLNKRHPVPKGVTVESEKITTITEDNGSAEDFAKQIDDLIGKYFPKSKHWAVYKKGLGESIYIRLAIGQKTDWSNGIIDNAPIEYGAIIFGIENGQTNDSMSLESSRGASITIKPPENSYLAYGRVKIPTRKTKGGEAKILKAIEKVLVNIKSQGRKNIGNMTDDHQWVKKYV